MLSALKDSIDEKLTENGASSTHVRIAISCVIF